MTLLSSNSSTLLQTSKSVITTTNYATTSAPGIVELGGDLGGTYSSPSVLNHDPYLVPTAQKTTAYTAAVNDFVLVNAASGAVTVTLPHAPADKTRIGVKKMDTSSNGVTIAASGGDAFEVTGGSTSGTMSLPYQSKIYQYEASASLWISFSGDTPVTQLETILATLASPTFTGTVTTPTPVVNNGVNWKISRHSTTASSSVSANTIGGSMPFTISPSSTLSIFDTTDYFNNVTVTTQAIGAITVPYTGLYAVAGAVHWSTVVGTSAQFMLGLTLNTSGTYSWIQLGTETCGTNLHRIGFAGAVSLSAGALIQPGYELPSTNTALGDSTGSYTFFSGALITRTA